VHAPIKDHLTLVLRGFLVRIQIPNLIPNLFLDHSSCILCLNEQFDGNLSNYTSRPFQWYLGGRIWCFFSFSTKALNIRDFWQSAFPKWECIWESLGPIFCIIPHLWERVSHINTFSWPHGPLDFTSSRKPNVKVATFSPTKKRGQCPHWHLKFSRFLHITILSPSLDLPWTFSFPCNCFPLFDGHQLLTFTIGLSTWLGLFPHNLMMHCSSLHKNYIAIGLIGLDKGWNYVCNPCINMNHLCM
jgi:hypothetical protein